MTTIKIPHVSRIEGHASITIDLDDPTKVLCRTPDWLMEPDQEWETKGFYDGVAFPCGNFIKDGTLYVYYGGGDVVCAVATCDVRKLLEYLKANPVAGAAVLSGAAR